MRVKDIVEGLAATYKIVKTGPEGTTLQSPDMHTMLTLDPEASKGIVANPEDPNHFVLSQAQASGTTGQPGQQPQGPKQGQEVEIPTNEGHGDRFEYSFETEIDDHEGNPINARIEYNIYGDDIPARVNYDDYDHEGESAQIDAVKVTNLDTGEDITDNVEVDDLIWDDFDQQQQSAANDVVDVPDDNYDDQYYDEDVGGDPTDDFIDDVRDKEFEKHNKANEDLAAIKKLSGL
jgi:hypothetical protein